jgi:tetratricopeptide (TPR) repeat protein
MKNGLEYDATMRVGFVMLRDEQNEGSQRLNVEFLGGYWKLPMDPTNSSDMRARCVSKARSSTAPVDAEVLEEVCAELGHSLSEVFASDKVGLNAISRRYAKNPQLHAYVLARHAAAQLQKDTLERSRVRSVGSSAPPPSSGPHDLLKSAQQRLASFRGLTVGRMRERQLQQDQASRFVLSYIERQLGVWHAQHQGWTGATVMECLKQSLKLHSTNASTEHLMGIVAMCSGDFEEARMRFISSISYDPDFKAAYINLGAVVLKQRSWECAMSVSEAGLQRHPQAFQCSYNLGLACAHSLRNVCGHGLRNDASCKHLAQRALTALRAAKEQRETKRSGWSKNDDELFARLEAVSTWLAPNSFVHFSVPLRDAMRKLNQSLERARGWELCNFRP